MATPGGRIIVGLDFGTTFSGFAYAHKEKPNDVLTYYDWSGGPRPYCKTMTAIYYDASDATRVKSWGYQALADYSKDMRQGRKAQAVSAVDLPEVGAYLTRFKLHLATEESGVSSAAPLPAGFTVSGVIVDYLEQIGASIMRHLCTKYGDHLTMESLQWCVTVPSIWENGAKKKMEACMAQAGLIKSAQHPDGSPHPLSIVLEPEAASCYCHRNMPDLHLEMGDRLLVADIGGGTTDIVVQEWISESTEEYKVKEVTHSTGGLCGGTYVDEEFKKAVFTKIGCLEEFLLKYPGFMSELLRRWEDLKCSFGDVQTIGDEIEINLPNKLAAQWENYELEKGFKPRASYDELTLTHTEMKAIFDPIVEQNLDLIADQLSRATNVKVIFVVGGFAGSPYLMTRIKARFGEQVPRIISPVNPGSAVCQGAVLLALNPGGIVSRISRRTYGFEAARNFKTGDPEEHSCFVGAVKKCDVIFHIYVRKGDPIEVNHYVTKMLSPLYPRQKTMKLTLYSSSETSPTYTRGPLVKEEATFIIDISESVHLDVTPRVNVSMYFGRTSIEVRAVGENFGKGEVQEMQLPVDYTGDWV